MDELMNENETCYYHAVTSHGQYFHANHQHQSQPAHSHAHHSAHSHHHHQHHAHQPRHAQPVQPLLSDFHFNYASQPFDEFMNDYHDESNKIHVSSFDTVIGIGHASLPQPSVINTDYDEYDNYDAEEDEEEEEEEEEEESGLIHDADDEYLNLTMLSLEQQQQQQQRLHGETPEKDGLCKIEPQAQADEDEKIEAEPPIEHKTARKNLIIWDWDDTIFPTYSFRTHQDEKDAQFMAKLDVLVRYIEKVFEGMIAMYGASNIVIVTNASETWINKCLNVDLVQDTFMNFQQNILKKHQIACISASTREITAKHPKNHHKWKEVAFAQLFDSYFERDIDLNEVDEDLINCITSIGDSICEYDASHNASKWVKNRILNRIRLKSNPSITEMINQLKDIASMIDQFGSSCDDMDIDYTSYNTPLSMSLSDTTC